MSSFNAIPQSELQPFFNRSLLGSLPPSPPLVALFYQPPNLGQLEEHVWPGGLAFVPAAPSAPNNCCLKSKHQLCIWRSNTHHPIAVSLKIKSMKHYSTVLEITSMLHTSTAAGDQTHSTQQYSVWRANPWHPPTLRRESKSTPPNRTVPEYQIHTTYQQWQLMPFSHVPTHPPSWFIFFEYDLCLRRKLVSWEFRVQLFHFGLLLPSMLTRTSYTTQSFSFSSQIAVRKVSQVNRLWVILHLYFNIGVFLSAADILQIHLYARKELALRNVDILSW